MKNPLVVGALGSLIAAIVIDRWKAVGMSLVKTLYGFLITIRLLDALELFFFSLFMVFLIKKWRNDIKRRQEDELKELTGKLKEKTQQYKKLFEVAKLPKTFDKLITVEISPAWYRQRQKTYTDFGKHPRLHFDMRVVNRTYHSFEPEEATIGCFCGREEVYKGTWDEKTRVSETFDRVTYLPKFGDGDIVFHVPIKKLYDDLRKWELEGTVKYRSKEPLIDDNQYTNPKIDIHLEYVLSEKQILELKEQVEKALGDEG